MGVLITRVATLAGNKGLANRVVVEVKVPVGSAGLAEEATNLARKWGAH